MLSSLLGQARSLWRAVTLAALLVFVDAFYLNQGVITALIGAGLLFIGVPRAFVAKLPQVRRQRFRNLAIYFTAVILVFVVNATNNHIAQTRAEKLVGAVKAYHAKYRRYPQSLNELIPEFAERIPRAKYTLLFGEFYYANTERRAFLFYTSMPPFGRPTYSFANDRWGYLD